MAKQKTFPSKMIAKLKRDARLCWNNQFIDVIRYTAWNMRKPMPDDAEALLGENALTLQQEAFIRAFYEEKYLGEKGVYDLDDVPFAYPGLMGSWESDPKVMELDASAADYLRSSAEDFGSVAIDDLRRFFPGCVLVDTRALGFAMYGISVDAVFAYPSYDQEREYSMLLLMGVSMKRGLHYPLESKLILKGATLDEALSFSREETARLRKRCMAGLDMGLHDEAFSPLSDEQPLLKFASRVLAFSCSQHADVEERFLSNMPHFRVSLRERDDQPGGEDGEEAAVEELEGASHEESGGESEESDCDETSTGVAAFGPDGQNAEEPLAAGGEVSPLDRDSLLALVESLQEENKGLKAALNASESQNASLGYHLKQAQGSVDRLKAEAEALRARAALVEGMDVPTTPLEALALAERAFPDKLIVLDGAWKSARAFEKGSPKEVWAVLRSMGTILHRLVFEDTSRSVVHSFQAESGFEMTLRDVKHTNNNADFAKERRVFYEGSERDITAHVKGRGSKKGESLRVHFFADYSAGKIVVAHCGEHLTTIKTSSL